MNRLGRLLGRGLVLLLLAALALQLFFVTRIALMVWWDPASTAFQRSEAWRIFTQQDTLAWRQQWVDYAQISPHLKRAVIAAEDDAFTQHDGVDWTAIEKAWKNNTKAQEQAARRGQARPPKIVGGSTISQQLAKNLLLSGERTLLRKGQELVLTFLLESLLDKRRILEIYLNVVEWGEGVFGAEAAAQRYYRKSAAQLSPLEAARLAVMLPRPRYFEKLPQSAYLAGRAQAIASRMGDSALP